MPKYKTKPVEIEAVQWTGANPEDIKAFGAIIREEELLRFVDQANVEVLTINEVYDYLQDTWVTMNPGDFIIRGNKGEFYPCEAEVFNWKYEEIQI
jgi:hypothetical protein